MQKWQFQPKKAILLLDGNKKTNKDIWTYRGIMGKAFDKLTFYSES